jgi:hypothetical protein
LRLVYQQQLVQLVQHWQLVLMQRRISLDLLRILLTKRNKKEN